MIELKHVTKKFGSRLAVDDLSLRVPEGEIYGLLGHNGAGKSTAIGIMLGQVWLTRGQVRVCRYDIGTHRRQALEHVGALFESPAFYDYLSGFRNLEILTSYSAATPRSRIMEIIEWVGLSGREHTKVRTYSHGMRARLALAQALLPNPRLLILDEPGDGLDPEGIHEMRETILRLRRELGLTILLSSHFLSEVEQLCTTIAVLNQGRLVFQGPMGNVKAQAGRVRLVTSDFPAACAVLRSAGLIDGDFAATWVVPRRGTGTDQIVKCLVQRDLPIFEIVREERSLEDFYLSLMSGEQHSVDGTNQIGRALLCAPKMDDRQARTAVPALPPTTTS